MTRALGLLLTLILAACCGDALALNSNGLSGGKAKKQRNDGGDNGADSNDDKNGDKAWQKQPLPAPENVAQLSTSVFDSVKDDLDLSDDQLKKVESAKKDIREKGEKIAKEQEASRAAYEKAKNEKACESALEKVAARAAACRRYAPQSDFNQALGKILASSQFTKFVELASRP